MTPNSCLSSYFKNKSPCFSGQAEGSSDDGEPGYGLQSDEIRARMVRTRLVSKIKERKKNFSFGFSVQSSDEGTQADVGEAEAAQQEATAAQASARRRTKKKKKKQASVQRAQTDNESQDREQAAPTDVIGDAIRLSPVVTSVLEGSRAHTNDTCPSSSPLSSWGDGDPPLPAAPAPALRSPPGLEVGAAQRGRHELQQLQQHAQPGVRSIAKDKKGLVHFDSWRHEGLSEEEKARKRYGQGVRNVTAIARRSTTGPGVIGKRVEDDVQGVKAMTTAFSFGFALG